jgi:hypothetical protein
MSAMKKFVEKHQRKITGTISTFDRIIFKGYLPFRYPEAVEHFLYSNGLLIKDFRPFAKKQSERIKQYAIDYAKKQSRPYQYLNEKIRKEELARQIADNDGIDQGLICVFAVLEQNPSYTLRYGENRPHLIRCRPRCLTLYYYFMDRQLGFMHVRLQTWLPFMIQVYHPYEFKIRRRGKRRGETVMGWFPMAKRVTNLYRYAEVSMAANSQYLDALSVVDDPSASIRMLDKLCSPAKLNGHRKRAMNPVSHCDVKLFAAVMRGEHFIHGFRNGHLAKHLGITLSDDKQQRRRQSSRIGRLLQLLRAHRLIAKVPRSRRYRVTLTGFKMMTAAVFLREEFMPENIPA